MAFIFRFAFQGKDSLQGLHHAAVASGLRRTGDSEMETNLPAKGCRAVFPMNICADGQFMPTLNITEKRVLTDSSWYVEQEVLVVKNKLPRVD